MMALTLILWSREAQYVSGWADFIVPEEANTYAIDAVLRLLATIHHQLDVDLSRVDWSETNDFQVMVLAINIGIVVLSSHRSITRIYCDTRFVSYQSLLDNVCPSRL